MVGNRHTGGWMDRCTTLHNATHHQHLNRFSGTPTTTCFADGSIDRVSHRQHHNKQAQEREQEQQLHQHQHEQEQRSCAVLENLERYGENVIWWVHEDSPASRHRGRA